MKKTKHVTGRLQVLVDQKLEGNLSAEESRELEHLLALSDEAKAYALQMEELHSSLQSAGLEKQETDLTGEVMARVKKMRAPVIIKTSIPLSLQLRAYKKELLKYAALLVIGVLLGSALTFLMFPGISPVSKKDIGATMSARSGQALVFNGMSWQIRIQPVTVSDAVVLVVFVKTTEAVQMNLQFGEQDFKLESSRFLSYDILPETAIQPGMVSYRVKDDMVAQLVLIRSKDVEKPIVLQVLQEGKTTFKRELFLP